jgi:hypothetical protein
VRYRQPLGLACIPAEIMFRYGTRDVSQPCPANGFGIEKRCCRSGIDIRGHPSWVTPVFACVKGVWSTTLGGKYSIRGWLFFDLVRFKIRDGQQTSELEKTFISFIASCHTSERYSSFLKEIKFTFLAHARYFPNPHTNRFEMMSCYQN